MTTLALTPPRRKDRIYIDPIQPISDRSKARKPTSLGPPAPAPPGTAAPVNSTTSTAPADAGSWPIGNARPLQVTEAAPPGPSPLLLLAGGAGLVLVLLLIVRVLRRPKGKRRK